MIHISKLFSAMLSFSVAVCFSLNTQELNAQSNNKNKLRINADYTKIMDGESFLNIKASARVDKKNVTVPDIELVIYNNVEAAPVELGRTMTNNDGVAKFVLPEIKSLKADSTSTYNFVIAFKGNDSFKKVMKTIHIKDVDIDARVIYKDSLHYVQAAISDPVTDSALVDMPLRIELQRLFRSLKIGDLSYNTNANGSILVPLEHKYPGVDGELTFEVILFENEEYGTVKDLITTDIGIPIVDESRYDDRTMWSSRDKTPVFLLVFPNIIIASIWGLIFYLTYNLFKIYKSKS